MSSFKIRSIKQLKNLKNKTVLVRCDFDVPLKRQRGTTRKPTRNYAKKIIITDDSRLKACVPTIQYLLSKGARIILFGHLGRPGGKVMPELSLEPVAKHLEKIISSSFCHSRPVSQYGVNSNGNPEIKNKKIVFIKNITDFNKEILKLVQDDKSEIVMLENLRFNPGEEKNDKKFAKKIATFADIYVNDAFAVSHRRAASVDAIKKYLPSYAGLNLGQEIKNLNTVMQKPKHPFVLIIGGAKIETKLPVIKNFLNKADYILVGGAVANDFLLAQDNEVGKSLIDKDYIEEAKKILNSAECQSASWRTNVKSMTNLKYQIPKIVLPVDVKLSNQKIEPVRRSDNRSLKSEGGHSYKILDIGPKTIKLFCDIIKKANTIIWNGPMGYFETKKFAKGTDEIAKAILKSKAIVVIGGGDTNQILAHNTSYIIHNTNVFVSTGGGAMLEFLGGKGLPGLNKIVK